MTMVPLTCTCNQVGKSNDFVVRSAYIYGYMLFIKNYKQALLCALRAFAVSLRNNITLISTTI